MNGVVSVHQENSFHLENAMAADAWLLLVLTLFAGAASPGPSLALVIRTALSDGRLAGILVAVAHGFGVGLYALIVALGIASILFQFAWAMTAVQLMGVLFIAYLGSSMIRGGLKTLHQHQENTEETTKPSDTTNALVHLRDGFLIVFLNPKIIVFFLAVFSQFLSADQPTTTQIAAAAVAGALDAAWYALVAFLVSAGQVAHRLRDYAGQIDIGFGVMLCIIAAIIAGQSLWPMVT